MERLSHWQFEVAEVKAMRFARQESVKNETASHILLVNMKEGSITDYMNQRRNY